MSSLIKIAITDNDIYFIRGLQEVLITFFKEVNLKCRFVEMSEANIIFHYFPFETSSCFCRLTDFSTSKKRLFFAIYPTNRKPTKKMVSTCFLESGAIYKDMPIALLLEKISITIGQNNSIINHHHHKNHCPHKLTLLTHREKEILYLIQQQYVQKRIALYLGLSHKTVCNHTRNIMSKLGIERKKDLICWLHHVLSSH